MSEHGTAVWAEYAAFGAKGRVLLPERTDRRS
jgi:hypothetical protein